VQEGDFLEATIVKDGVLLKPVSIVERKRGWERMMRAASQVKDLEPNPQEDIAAEEEKIAEAKAVLDTTVLVSGFLKRVDGGVLDELLRC
jgi:hypothetical protein